MADIAQDLANIKSAIYGEDVRGSIHDAIRDINTQVEDWKTAVAASASAAANSASEASNYASAANSSKNAAADSVTQASNYASAANSSKNAAAASASNAATSAEAAAQSAEEAREAAIGQVYAETIPMGRTDPTKISVVLASLNEVIISFTSLQFTQSGNAYIELIENTAIHAYHKPGLLLLTDERARSSGALTVTTAEGQLTLSLPSAPPSGIAFSGELHLNKAG